MKKIIVLVLGLVISAPLLVSAVGPYDGTITGILYTIGGWIGYILPVLITLAIAYFVWGVIQFMSSSDEEAKKNGRLKIINGLIGLFVIVAFWGIIALVQKTFGIRGDGIDKDRDAIAFPLQN